MVSPCQAPLSSVNTTILFGPKLQFSGDLVAMSEHQPSNEELTFAAGLSAIFLCILFGSNAVAIKITFSGLGVFTTAAIRFGIAAVAIFCGLKSPDRTLL